MRVVINLKDKSVVLDLNNAYTIAEKDALSFQFYQTTGADDTVINDKARKFPLWFDGRIRGDAQPGVTRSRYIPSITRQQLRYWLVYAHISEDAIVGQINAIADPVQKQKALIDWQDAPSYQRNNPLVESIGTALGLNTQQLDSAFLMAGKMV